MKALVSHPDRIAGVTLTAIGLFLLYTASSLPFGRLSAPDAGFFPIVLAAMLTMLGTILLVRSFRIERFSLEIESRSWLVLLCAAALVLYAVLVNRVGFILCTTAILMFLTRAYGLSLKRSMLFCIPAVLLAYVGFSELGVPLPRGWLGWF